MHLILSKKEQRSEAVAFRRWCLTTGVLHGHPAELFLAPIQFVESALQVFKPLSSLA